MAILNYRYLDITLLKLSKLSKGLGLTSSSLTPSLKLTDALASQA